VAVLAAAAAGGWWFSQREAGAAAALRTGTIERGKLQATVSATGAVNPVKQVSVGSQISGQVREVYVDFNSEVKAGQLIAEIDAQTFEYRLRSASADLDAAQAAVAIAQANAASARANVSRAQTELAEARRAHERNLSLVAQGFIAQSEADRTRAALAASEEGLKAVQALQGVSEAQIRSAQANVKQREAAVAQARVDLSRTRITSPVDGIVIKRTIERGQTVAASLQAPELFVIAQNLSDMQVDASIDEADVGRIRPGQKVSFTVDAFPGRSFDGEVKQVRKAATNVSNVVTYVAVVSFANTNSRLLPGMTANVRIVTESRDNVLKVPNAALRVRLADFSDRTLAEFFVGDYGPSSDFAYARLAGASEAWAMPAAAAGYVYASRLSWQDLRVLPAGIAAQDVQELKAEGYLELEAGGRAPLGYALRREGSSWVSAGTAVDGPKVEAMLRSLLGLRASGYGSPSGGGMAGTARVVMSLGDGRTLTLSLAGRLADGRYMASSSARDRPFVILGGAALDAFKPLELLRP